MQHTAGNDRGTGSEATQTELPALLVPGGSCSSLCRSHSRDGAERESRAANQSSDAHRGHAPLQEHVLVAANDEWARLTPEDHTEIRNGGVATLLMKLSQRYGWNEGKSMAKLRALMTALEKQDVASRSRDSRKGRMPVRTAANGTDLSH